MNNRYKIMSSALEHILISTYKEGMIAFMHSHPEYFEDAIKLAVSDKPLYSWRAAWLLWSCIEDNDKRIRRHIKNIIYSLARKEDGHQRELLKILLRMELSKDYEGFLFETCMNIWEQINKKPSVRYTAFKVILKIAKKYPHLAQEIDCLVTEMYLDSLSPGVKRSLFRIIKESGIRLQTVIHD